MEQKIIEGNKLIAEFMGFEYLPDSTLNGIKGYCRHEEYSSFHFDLSKPFHAIYHESWDWLMPVLDKIATIESPGLNGRFLWGLNNSICSISAARDGAGPIFTTHVHPKAPIEAMWETIIKFITWYNNTEAPVEDVWGHI